MFKIEINKQYLKYTIYLCLLKINSKNKRSRVLKLTYFGYVGTFFLDPLTKFGWFVTTYNIFFFPLQTFSTDVTASSERNLF